MSSISARRSIVDLVALEDHLCALRADGSLVCAEVPGRPRGVPFEPAPARVLRSAGVRAIAGGVGHLCFSSAEGPVQCVGSNYGAALGVSDKELRHSDQPIPVPGVRQATMLAAGLGHTCALLRDGGVSCWGEYGLGGAGALIPGSRRPARVPGLKRVAEISAGLEHTCARLEDGSVWCWGRLFESRMHGQPTRLEGITQVVSLASGAEHVCALRRDRTVWCWGRDDFRQLGRGNTEPAHRPGPVKRIAQAIAVGAGGNHSCALLDDGSVWCWGLDEFGETASADGTGAIPVSYDQKRAYYPEPRKVAAILGAVKLALSGTRSCALLGDDTVRCWGGAFREPYGVSFDTTRRACLPPTLRRYGRLHHVSSGPAGPRVAFCAFAQDSPFAPLGSSCFEVDWEHGSYRALDGLCEPPVPPAPRYAVAFDGERAILSDRQREGTRTLRLVPRSLPDWEPGTGPPPQHGWVSDDGSTLVVMRWDVPYSRAESYDVLSGRRLAAFDLVPPTPARDMGIFGCCGDDDPSLVRDSNYALLRMVGRDLLVELDNIGASLYDTKTGTKVAALDEQWYRDDWYPVSRGLWAVVHAGGDLVRWVHSKAGEGTDTELSLLGSAGREAGTSSLLGAPGQVVILYGAGQSDRPIVGDVAVVGLAPPRVVERWEPPVCAESRPLGSR